MPRYIDAEKLKQRMFSYYSCVNEHTSKSNYTGETLMNYEVADMIEDCIDNAPDTDVAPRAEVAREIIGEVFSYVHGNEKLTENIPEIELFKFGMFIGELEKKYDPKSKRIITDNTHQE